MKKTFGNESPQIEEYVSRTYAPEDDVLREIRERCQREGLPDIQLGSLDARHLEVLVRLANARHAIEIGTLGGYSGVAILRGLSPDGRLDTFEMNPHHARIAEDSFARAGFAGRVRIHVGPALERLATVEREAPFDLCFIDADKENYAAYLDWAARHLRRGGVVIGDNAFLFGEVGQTGRAAVDSPSPALRTMRAFHDRLAANQEFRATVLPTGEGLAVGIKL